ncbi:MAG: penicillin-binding protein 2 [Verrucomicrobia bacterium]|nr:penicillin-binding protein 2 [Verrucomicrobiota bacterium]
MARAEQFKRLLLMSVLLVAALCGLGYRLVDLQVWRHKELGEAARNNTERTFIREPRRGDIRDVRGTQLATSIFVKTVIADPTIIGTNITVRLAVARTLAPLLEKSAADLFKDLTPVPKFNAYGVLKTNAYALLKSRVTFEKWEEIKTAMRHADLGVDETTLTNKLLKAYYRGVHTAAISTARADDQLRIYPNAALAAHVLGYVGVEEKESPIGAYRSTTGRDGIELVLNQPLTGVQGWLTTETDKRKNELAWAREQNVPSMPGRNVCLTLDAGVQLIVESELAEAWKEHTPISVSCIVVRPKTGEVLAMATLPNFNPNNVGATPVDARRNRMIADTAEPGSTFKIVVISGGLNEKLVTLRDPIDCEHGKFIFHGKPLKDHEAYGILSVEDVVAKSSNIGSAKVGIRLGEQRLYDYIRNFGFGARTGLPLPGEVNGILHPVKKWDGLAISRIPMGHAMTCTPMQMVMAMCAVANNGVLMRPMLIDRLEDDRGQVVTKYSPQPAHRVVSEETAKTLVVALKKVVSKDGTAELAQMKNYTVAGKTGTATKVEHGQYVNKYFSSFIGFFPADDPELCISVVFDEPKHGYYGGKTAAPVFKRIAERSAAYLKIKPDRGPDVSPLAGDQKPFTTAKKD